MKKRKSTEKKSDSAPISLAPLDFATAIRAAMQTGKPPTANKSTVKSKRKTRKGTK